MLFPQPDNCTVDEVDFGDTAVLQVDAKGRAVLARPAFADDPVQDLPGFAQIEGDAFGPSDGNGFVNGAKNRLPAFPVLP